MSAVLSNGAALGRGRGSGLMRLHWAVISVMSDSCQRQQQGDTKWRRLSSYPWRRRQRWRRRRHLLQAAAAASFSGSASAQGRRGGGGARPDLPEDLDNLLFLSWTIKTFGVPILVLISYLKMFTRMQSFLLVK